MSLNIHSLESELLEETARTNKEFQLKQWCKVNGLQWGDFLRLVTNPDYTAPAVIRVFKKHGLDLSRNTVRTLRRRATEEEA